MTLLGVSSLSQVDLLSSREKDDQCWREGVPSGLKQDVCLVEVEVRCVTPQLLVDIVFLIS